MSLHLFSRALLRNPEYQSAWVRLAIWSFSVTYIGLASWTGYYAVDVFHYYLLFSGYFFFFVGLLISVYHKPELNSRRYITLVIDISATSVAIYLTKEAISPFYLIYIWIFVSYGTRYGKRLLMIASILSVLAYNIVLYALNEWQTHTFEAIFFLLLLVMLPMYQYSLLRKLHQARQEAERANKARGDFLATMTHELRTPLTGVIGMARLLQTTPLDVEQREYLHSIQSSAHLLRALIGDILDFSKIDANKLELESARFDIRDLVRNVSSNLATEAQEKHVELVCRVDARVPRELLGDRLRVSQILYNLLGNAIKFTDRGEVTLRLSVESGGKRVPVPHILLEVEDTGIGIPAEKLDKIFDMFWQSDVSTSRRFGGTGLGTTVARDLTRLMGGWIAVRSKQGHGTTFSVRLPLLPKQVGSLAVKPPQLAGKRLLIFETHRASMQAHLEAARELGMESVPITSLEELTRLREMKFDLVLVCDALDGFPLSLLLERLEASIDVRTPVLLAGYRGRTVGRPPRVSGLILKPFIADQLAEVAISLLVGRGQDKSASGEPPSAASMAAESGIRILLAEDNAIAAKVFQTLLIRKGHQVISVKDGEAALQAATDGGYHLAFIDLRMPHMDGLEFTRHYRAVEPSELHMPILALTANTAEDVLTQCLDAGMDGFLNKPVEPEQLDAIVARYVRRPDYSRTSTA
ncbi:MAG: ATP-binding protein [Pseudomonadota bacterium]